MTAQPSYALSADDEFVGGVANLPVYVIEDDKSLRVHYWHTHGDGNGRIVGFFGNSAKSP